MVISGVMGARKGHAAQQTRTPGGTFGPVEAKQADLIAWFWSYVVGRDDPEGCWVWTKGTNTDQNYGQLRLAGSRRVQAHRFAYELLVGPIPPGLHLDHTCHNADLSCTGGPTCRHRRCVNPAHLEAVTSQENTRRMVERRRLISQPRSKHGA